MTNIPPEVKERLAQLEENFNTKWGAYTRFVSEHPKTGQAIAASVGGVLGLLIGAWWF